jgi:hypothetical protein
MTKTKATIICVVILVILAFIAGVGLHQKTVIQYSAKLEQLKNGWTQTMAELVDAKTMRDNLARQASTLDATNRKLARDNATLKIELAEVKKKGKATIVNNAQGIPWVAHYEDQLVTLTFDMESYDFDYALKPRPINLTLVSGTDNTWKALAFDPIADKEVKINNLQVMSVPYKKPWYKKLKTVAVYAGTVAVAGGLGYMAGRIF